MQKKDIIKKYEKIPIGKTNLNKDMFINEILSEDDLKVFLHNSYSPGDESLTKEGVKFLEEYYGLDVIVDLILREKDKGADYGFKDKVEVKNWLERFKSL